MVAVWDKNDCNKGAEKQLENKNIYQEACNDPGPLICTVQKVVEKKN